MEGQVKVLLDGKEIGNSTMGKMRTSVSFDVANGSNLTIQADNRSIIRLFNLNLECGNESIVLYLLCKFLAKIS